ncbi:MAG TPA: hypothetical protein VM694_24230, partial [Polyangium sp.]|nr:hypothetical protein [Polyangium sp.]
FAIQIDVRDEDVARLRDRPVLGLVENADAEVDLAAVGSAAAFALQTLSNTNPLNALLAVAGVALGVMMISGFLGWLKLRRRDVSALLEASGWAFNVRIYLRRNLSLRFTRVPPLPRGSVRERSVLPVFVSGEDEVPVGRIVIVLAVIALGGALTWHYREVLVASFRHFFRF